MENIKGLKVTVTVNMDIRAEEIKLSNRRKYDDINERASEQRANALDCKLGASIELSIDEAEGDNLFGEVGDVISDELANQIAKLVGEEEEKVDKGE